MITIKNFGNRAKMGGLGNQLFQINALAGISEKTGHPVMLSGWKYADEFDIKMKFGNPPGNCIPIKENNFHFDLSPFEGLDQRKNYDFTGYLQSEKYFADRTIKFKQPTAMSTRMFLKWFLGQKKETVAVHVRRGDYVGNPYYHQLPYTYFLEVLEKKIPDLLSKRIMVFSDDIEYCKSVFPKNFLFMAGNTEIEDLFLMSLCDYHVLSNSTFSWWGAYLSNSKRIICPDKYFAGNGLKNDTKDFWPDNWHKFNG